MLYSPRVMDSPRWTPEPTDPSRDKSTLNDRALRDTRGESPPCFRDPSNSDLYSLPARLKQEPKARLKEVVDKLEKRLRGDA